MKKFLFWATLVACSLIFVGCKNGSDPSSDAEVNRIKAAAVGSWQGELVLLRLANELEDYGKVEQLPTLEGKRMIMTIVPKKKK